MLLEFIEQILKKNTNLLNYEKLKNGHNGPYRDKETNIRKLAHLLVLYSNLKKNGIYEIDIEHIRKIKNAILKSENYKGGAYFKFRNKSGKDEVNGVIGVAWVIEGLCSSYEVLKDKDILFFVENLINCLKFNNHRKLWERPVNNENDKYGVDETFNHQLWLAYAIIYYSKIANKELPKDVKLFFTYLDTHLLIHKEGLIKHALKNKSNIKSSFKQFLKDAKLNLKSKLYLTTTKYKEDGYHLFNMFSFARLKALGYEDLFMTSKKFQRALKYCESKTLIESLLINKDLNDYYKIEPVSNLEINRYGFPYNVSGFEFFYVSQIFNLKNNLLKEKYLNTQLNVYGFNSKSKTIEKEFKTEDKTNLLLRLYELTFCEIIN